MIFVELGTVVLLLTSGRVLVSVTVVEEFVDEFVTGFGVIVAELEFVCVVGVVVFVGEELNGLIKGLKFGDIKSIKMSQVSS